MGTNTAPADDEKLLELDKTKGKNHEEEEVESSGEEDEDKSLDKLNSKNTRNDADKHQELYFKTGLEKATNMKANMVPRKHQKVGISNKNE